MAEEKQLSSCDTIYVVGCNDGGQLGLGHCAVVKEIAKWSIDNDVIPMPTRVHNGAAFAIISTENRRLSLLTFEFIRETCECVPEPIMQVCVEYGADGRSFFLGNNEHCQCGVGSAEATLSVSPITYFSDRAIRIAAICTNHVSSSTFWIAAGHTVYGAGENEFGQLGISNWEDQRSPERIKALDDKLIVDIQAGQFHSLALSDNGCVYSVEYAVSGGCGHGGAFKSGWNLISALQRTKIRQIAVGGSHSVFLDCDGVVFGCGDNVNGQLGLGHKKTDKRLLPTAIPVFQEQNTKNHQNCRGQRPHYGTRQRGQGVRVGVEQPRPVGLCSTMRFVPPRN